MTKRRKEVFEILTEIDSIGNVDARIKALADLKEMAINDILKIQFDDRYVLQVPDTAPPYTPSEPHNHPTTLHRETVHWKHIIRGGNNHISQVKREKILIGMLESVHPEDAKVIVGVITGEWPFENITEEVVKAAKPHFFE